MSNFKKEPSGVRMRRGMVPRLAKILLPKHKLPFERLEYNLWLIFFCIIMSLLDSDAGFLRANSQKCAFEVIRVRSIKLWHSS